MSSFPRIRKLLFFLATCFSRIEFGTTFSIITSQHAVATSRIHKTGLVLLLASKPQHEEEQWESVDNVELIQDEYGDDKEDDADEWLPDQEKAKRRKERARIYAEKLTTQQHQQQEQPSTQQQKQQEDKVDSTRARPSAYTDEEEQVIAAMGGKTFHPDRKREPGFLGDSTLQEIATDYSVPICYLADVLCMWDVPPPIHVDDRLGDLVTGEQAFAILEAVHSLDVSALHDRYSNMNLINICAEWDIDLQKAFEMCMREGWSLPFGVQTCLRVEQEDALVDALGNRLAMSSVGDDGGDDDNEYKEDFY